MTPGERATLDQATKGTGELLATFGVDRHDPVAMGAALAAIRALTVVFAATPGGGHDEITAGFLRSLTELQP
jgi:hypothetical protein